MASGSRQTTRRAVGARSCVHSAEQIYCPQEGVWETTLAGLTIPGPCRTGQFGQSSRTCRVNGEWENVDYSDCYDMGCRADAEWTDSPIRTTLMRMCPAGYTGYQYRYCGETGEWGAVDASDCGSVAAGW